MFMIGFDILNVGRRRFLVAGSEDSLVYVWDRDTSQLLEKLDGHTSIINSISSTGNLFISSSDDSSIRVWESIEDYFDGVDGVGK